MNTYTHMYTQAYVHICMCVHIYIYMCMYMCICIKTADLQKLQHGSVNKSRAPIQAPNDGALI